ncbi:MAG: RidA family protein [Sphingopyxis sp.]|nr:RidA family protein [Sphingopyxis sp.]
MASGRAYQPSGTSYSQAWLVERAERILFVSGQVPADAAGAVPEGFDAQCRLVWANIMRRLADAGMALTDIAKVNIFLSSRDHRAANTTIRHEILGDHSPAITVIITGIFDEAWLLEIDVIACA